VLDEPIIGAIPEILEAIRNEAAPLLGGLTQMQSHIANMSATTDRLTHLVDDVGTRLGSLPGAGLIARGQRRTAKTRPDALEPPFTSA